MLNNSAALTTEQLARHVLRMRAAQKKLVENPKSHKLIQEARQLEYAIDAMIQGILNNAEMEAGR